MFSKSRTIWPHTLFPTLLQQDFSRLPPIKWLQGDDLIIFAPSKNRECKYFWQPCRAPSGPLYSQVARVTSVESTNIRKGNIQFRTLKSFSLTTNTLALAEIHSAFRLQQETVYTSHVARNGGIDLVKKTWKQQHHIRHYITFTTKGGVVSCGILHSNGKPKKNWRIESLPARKCMPNGNPSRS